VLADEIAAALLLEAGATATELAERLGAPERTVSLALVAAHGCFWSDRGSPERWWLAEDSRGKIPPGSRVGFVPPVQPSTSLGLFRWQAEALEAWEQRGGRGVVEAVTGAGKTRVGVAAALDELWRRGQVLVLVPTIELQHQWAADLQPHLPAGRRVGRLGADAGDSLVTHDVLVAVVNSARAVDVRPIRQDGLLVADECHRYGSAVNQLALDARFRHRLGLSATYAREDDGNLAWLDPYFGGTCFRLDYARAIGDGVTARFSVTVVGVIFSSVERAAYDELTERMAGLRARLIRQHGVDGRSVEVFLRMVAALAEGAGEGCGVARAYRQAMLERRRMLADTPAKDAALLRVAPAIKAAERTIVFTRSIAGSQRAARVLAGSGVETAVIHSALSGGQREEVLRRFGNGEIRVLTAPRVLDEGIDVPAADLAVIVGASRSRRQMVQRMGRILRRKPDGRRARFAILFVENTVEDPRLGAHEAFLADVTDVADEVSCFPAEIVSEGHDGVIAALQP
jgi:superfamily II DNA or RNA helicase